MLKKLVSLSLVLCMVLAATVMVFANASADHEQSNLYYEDGKVCCYGVVMRTGSEIDLTMKLYRNGRTIRTWNATGYDLVQMDETYPAVSGSTYQLSFVCSVDGNPVTIPTKTLVCP